MAMSVVQPRGSPPPSPLASPYPIAADRHGVREITRHPGRGPFRTGRVTGRAPSGARICFPARERGPARREVRTGSLPCIVAPPPRAAVYPYRSRVLPRRTGDTVGRERSPEPHPMTTETVPQKPVLLTGASGALGRVLTRALGEQGWALRLTDRAPFPDPPPAAAPVQPHHFGRDVRGCLPEQVLADAPQVYSGRKLQVLLPRAPG